MKVTIRTVANVKFDLELEASMKVSDVKAKIEAEQGSAFPQDDLTLVYKGKVLLNGDTIESAQVTENSFMVVMVKKTAAKPVAPTPATPAPAAAATPAETPAAPAPSAPEPQSAAPAAAESTPAPEAAAAPTPAAGSGGMLIGPELRASISAIVEMGFPQADVERAMRAAFNNPDRAVEYLMSGIPESAAGAAAPPAAAPAPAASAPTSAASAAPAAAPAPAGPNAAPLDLFGGAAAGGGGAAGGDAGGPLAALRNNPQFAQIRAMIQADPSSLPRLLTELSAQNPALMQLLQQNQAEFLRMLMEPQGGAGGANVAEVLNQMMGQAEPMETIELSEADDEAIQRLEALGFTRAACINAYFACDKQEELAANLLFDGGLMEDS